MGRCREVTLKETAAKRFWDEAAADDPYWYVSSYGAYGADRNVAEFWASGAWIWDEIKRNTEYTPRRDHLVVEIGCGVGRLTRAIAPEVGRVIALDISEGMLAVARQSALANAEFRPAQGFALNGIPSGSADLTLGYCVFQHLPSHAALESYLAEMLRVTKPEGLLAFTLEPRDWSFWLLPVMRVRAYLRERLSGGGPKGTYRKAWVGIRPASHTVARLAPISLQRRVLDPHRVLYFGRCS